ncbi:MAG: Hsp20/alpha crystallin family protein [Gemmatimonadota bacterium]|nr:Hsp20/alpha crystallin family protein [Gemmatimonadota bacterium]MDP6529606.1 Hsp20/alpha crystallin family protein [Gemmatimonadota bacterium]MDP6802929.1 Hsp20/alpha crystallin family protein [Gemmatimonadota bacterium]MDP7030659.1 Hsp20/alpha crystallin family protein [Gemmatimonadota bacterium]
MLTIRTNDFRPAVAPGSGFARIFDELLETGAAAPAACGTASPALNVYENEEAFVVRARVPGLSMSALEVSLLGRELTLSGSAEENADGPGSLRIHEWRSAPFRRIIRLGADVDAQAIAATLDSGILTVTLPKAETARPKKIDVKIR